MDSRLFCQGVIRLLSENPSGTKQPDQAGAKEDEGRGFRNSGALADEQIVAAFHCVVYCERRGVEQEAQIDCHCIVRAANQTRGCVAEALLVSKIKCPYQRLILRHENPGSRIRIRHEVGSFHMGGTIDLIYLISSTRLNYRQIIGNIAEAQKSFSLNLLMRQLM